MIIFNLLNPFSILLVLEIHPLVGSFQHPTYRRMEFATLHMLYDRCQTLTQSDNDKEVSKEKLFHESIKRQFTAAFEDDNDKMIHIFHPFKHLLLTETRMRAYQLPSSNPHFMAGNFFQ